MQNKPARFLMLWGMFFVILFPCLFSFPHPLLPDYGYYGSQLLSAPLRFTGESIFKLSAEEASRRISDSKGLYVAALFALFLSALVAAYFHKKEYSIKILGWLKVFIRYYVAWFLLIYGFSKVFKYQFYFPEPNILFSFVGDLHKDILYWSAMGVSRGYNIVTGLVELTAAFLLLFRRVSFAGSLLAALLFAHIVVVNFSFDISVKLFSSFLFLSSLLLVLTDWQRLKVLAGSNAVPEADMYAVSGSRVLKWIIVILLMTDVLWPYARAASFNGDAQEKPVLSGAYTVTDLNSASKWKRVFYHSKDYFIVQSEDGKMKDYLAVYEEDKHSLKLVKESDAWHLTCKPDSDSSYILKGIIASDTIAVRLTSIDLDSLPLLKDEFSFTTD